MAAANAEAAGASLAKDCATCAQGSAEASEEWLGGALAEERAALAAFLEQRHAALLAQFSDRRAGGRPEGDGQLPGHVEAHEESPAVLSVVPASGIGAATGSSADFCDGSAKAAASDKSIAAKKAPWTLKAAWCGTSSGEGPSKSGSSLRLSRVHTPSFLQGVIDGSNDQEVALDGYGRVQAFVASPRFETFFALLIVVNAVVMGLESQYQGLQNGVVVQYAGTSPESSSELWPWAKTTFLAFEWMFGCMFVAELVLKAVALRTQFLKDIWNWLDTFLVMVWLVSQMGSVQFPINPTLLRNFRLCRLLRLLRLVRSMNGFDALFLMTTAMRGSFSILAWAVIVIVAAQMIIAVCLQAVLEEFILDEAEPIEKRQHVFQFYGTFSRTMLTMFEMTFGNWMPPCRALVENVSEWFMLFSICHKLLIGFSVVSVINGVFIQETFKVAGADDQIMTRAQEKANKRHGHKMAALFKAADANGDGKVDRREFEAVLSTPTVRVWLAAMGLAVEDAQVLFTLLDAGKGQGVITVEDLMQGVGKLKGAARSIDVRSLMHEIRQTQVLVQRVCHELNIDEGRTAGARCAAAGQK